MFKQFTTRFSHQASALGMALIATLMMMSSMNQLATQPHDESLAQGTAPASMQVVVIEGQRSART